MRFVLVGTVTLALCGVVAARDEKAKKPTDAEMTKLLVGTWSIEEEIGDGKVTVHNVHKKDGTFEGQATIGTSENKIELKVSGTWEVKAGKFVTTVKKTSSPGLVPVGLVSKDDVLDVTEKEFRYKTEMGKEKTQMRVKE